MKNVLKAAVFVAGALMVAGCSTLSTKLVQPNTANMPGVRKIALTKIVFSERPLPVFPLIDAGIYRKRVSDYQDKLSEVERLAAEEMTKFYADKIQAATSKEVVVAGSTPERIDYTYYDGTGSPTVAAAIKKIAADNQAQLVVAAVCRVNTLGAGVFGTSGQNVIESSIYLFNDDAKLVGQATFMSEAIGISPQDEAGYKKVVMDYQTLGPQIVKMLF